MFFYKEMNTEKIKMDISYNVWDIRSFSGTKWKENLGEARAES